MTDRITAAPPPRPAPETTQAGIAISRAAERTGVDFDYLLAQAQIESGMNPHAKASTSSATGLFQFIDQTWLAVLDRHGERLGYGALAQAIETTEGRAQVTDPAMRQQILDLRYDPAASSMMAAALASDNGAELQTVLGRAPDASELYLAHFLGAAGASRFLGELASNPGASAVDLLPRAAAANPSIFRNRSGGARSLGEVMEVIRGRVGRAMNQPQFAAGRGSAIPDTPSARFALAAQSAVPGLPGRIQQASGSQAHRSMAETLRQGFQLGSSHAGDLPGTAHVRSAYARLKAFGL